MDNQRTRRNFLKGGSGAVGVALAGCTSLIDPDEADDVGDDVGDDSDDEDVGVDDADDVDDDTSDDEEDLEPAFEEAFDPEFIFLTWQRDPTTTMTVDWHIDGALDRAPELEYRPQDGEEFWTHVEGETVFHADDDIHPDPDTEYDQTVNRVELTGLSPGTEYELRFGTAPVWSFKTMPEEIDEPFTYASGGDTDHARWDPILEVLMEHDPEFLVIAGDLPYADGGTSSDHLPRWYSWFGSIKDELVDEDGRILPVVVGIGNHEVRSHYFDSMVNEPGTAFENYENDEFGDLKHADFVGDPMESRMAWAPFFYTFFAFPGDPGYDVLDFGEYLSIVMTDTYHSNPIYGEQTEWLDTVLAERQDVPHVHPYLHAPIYPSHRSADLRYTRHIQDAWLPLLEREEIPISFGHHDHTTKITPPLLDGEIDESGLVEVGDGCMGMPPREVHPERQWIEHARQVNCVNIVTIDEETEYVNTVGRDGETLQDIEREVRL